MKFRFRGDGNGNGRLDVGLCDVCFTYGTLITFSEAALMKDSKYNSPASSSESTIRRLRPDGRYDGKAVP